MNINEAALEYEKSRERAASSGQDNAFLRVGVRSGAYDDNGEPLCSEPIIRNAAFDRHHIDTE